MWELGVVVGQGCSGGREGRDEVLKGRTIWVARDGGETGEGGGAESVGVGRVGMPWLGGVRV